MDKIKAVTTDKAMDMLNCNRTNFYKHHYAVLKPYSFLDVNWKNRRLYPLNKVQELKDEIERKSQRYEIVD